MSVVNTELSLKLKRVILMMFSIDLVYTKRTTFTLECFLQFACTNLDGSQKEGGNFLNLLQKEGVRRKRGSFRKEGRFQSGGNYVQNSCCFLLFRNSHFFPGVIFSEKRRFWSENSTEYPLLGNRKFFTAGTFWNSYFFGGNCLG